MTQALKRALFGYQAAAVRQILADRETMFHRAVEDARNAESQLEEVNTKLGVAREETSSSRSDLAERDRELQDAVKRAADLDAELERARQNERQHAEQVRRADAESEGLRSELAALRRVVDERGAAIVKRDAEIVERDATIAELGERVERLESDIRSSEASSEAPTDAMADATTPASSPAELDRMLAKAGQTITRMVEDARHTAELELAQTERRRDAVRAEIDRLEAWRECLVPLANDVGALLTETETQAAEIDGRLRSAIEPMTRAVASLRGRLGELIDRTAEFEMGEGTGRTEEARSTGDRGNVVHLSGDGPLQDWSAS